MSAIFHDVHQGPRPAAPATKWSNGSRHRRTAYPSDSSAPLSNDQKAAICMRAAAACVRLHAGADARTIEAWRRAEQRKATGHESLTTCTQRHYQPLMAHFANLAGEAGVAMTAHVQAATEPHRVAMHKLASECTARGLTLAWPATICRSKFKCALEEATAKQIWQLVFDVRSSKHAVVKKDKETRRGGDKATGPLGPLPAKLTFTKTGGKPAPQATADGDPF